MEDESQQKIAKLAQTLKEMGLAVSDSEALEKAKATIQAEQIVEKSLNPEKKKEPVEEEDQPVFEEDEEFRNEEE
ncbi:MAG: hypothetical protein ABIJ08_02950 [Nanoarchaeota archaeon]